MKHGSPILELTTQQFRITLADLLNSKHIASEIQTNNLSVAKKMTNFDTQCAILVMINQHLFWVLIQFILYILGKKSFTSLRIPYIATTMVEVVGYEPVPLKRLLTQSSNCTIMHQIERVLLNLENIELRKFTSKSENWTIFGIFA